MKKEIDTMKVVLDIIRRRGSTNPVPIAEITHIAHNRYGIKEQDCLKAIDDLLRKTSDIYEPEHGYVRLVKQEQEPDCRETCEQVRHDIDEIINLKNNYQILKNQAEFLSEETKRLTKELNDYKELTNLLMLVHLEKSGGR